jgi:hypothetical protein
MRAANTDLAVEAWSRVADLACCGGAFASDARHADDDRVKAASEEEDRLLNSRIKSICRDY